MSNEHVETFGRLLMKCARDDTLAGLRRVLAGTMRDRFSQWLHERAQQLGQKARDLLLVFADAAVDKCLFNLMCMIEDHADVLTLMVKSGDETVELRRVSDGLQGDSFSWIRAFSEYESPMLKHLDGEGPQE